MKIYVLHGEDSLKSYERLIKFTDTAKARGWEVTYIDSDSKLSLGEILSTPNLFGDERFFVLKDIKLLKDKDFKWLSENSDNIGGNLVIYSDTPIGKTFLNKLPKAQKIEEFRLPQKLFNFLDSLYPGNSSQAITLFNEISGTQPVEFTFALLAKLFRDMYWALVGELPYPSWRAGKIKRQALLFGQERLKGIIGQLADIDIKAKTGQANLKDELDLFLTKSLE